MSMCINAEEVAPATWTQKTARVLKREADLFNSWLKATGPTIVKALIVAVVVCAIPEAMAGGGGGDLKQLVKKVAGIVMMMAFLVGLILGVVAGWQFKSGDPDKGKMSLLGMIILCSGPAILLGLGPIVGLEWGDLKPEF